MSASAGPSLPMRSPSSPPKLDFCAEESVAQGLEQQALESFGQPSGVACTIIAGLPDQQQKQFGARLPPDVLGCIVDGNACAQVRCECLGHHRQIAPSPRMERVV